jgi:phosphoribosylformimino-5-aminoimidazole carboxamide ribotide isomerase
MFLLPVMDLLGGVVVRGISGRRSEYRPVVSRIAESTHPFDVAAAFRDHFGFSELYLADLDAIAGHEPVFTTFEGLSERGFRCWVDAGLRDEDDARRLRVAGDVTVVAGLETVRGRQALERIVTAVGCNGVAFSLDLRGGEPLGDRSAWEYADALTIAGQAVAVGIRRLIVLDVARVGAGGGTGTEDLCTELKRRWPDVSVIAGGGVRGVADLRRLRALAIDGVLVASALHDGLLTRQDVDDL